MVINSYYLRSFFHFQDLKAERRESILLEGLTFPQSQKKDLGK